MKTINVTWKGTTPLIMCSCKCVNPLHPLSLEMKKITDKPSKKRTEEDLIHKSDLEWEAGLYWDDNIGLHIPAENIEAAVRDGAKASRKGMDVVRGFNVVDMLNPLDIGEKLTFEELKSEYRFRDVRQMRVKAARVPRTRPRFNMWTLRFTATYDETQLDINTIVNAMDYAGKYIGLCDSRPKYGKFVVTIEEVD